MKASLLLTLLVACALPHGAEAKAKKIVTTPVEETLEFQLPVPSSELKLKNYGEEAGPDTSSLELSYSSWSPSEFTRPTYRSGNKPFRNGAYPLVGLSFLSPVNNERSNGSGFFYRLGFSSVQLVRDGQYQQQKLGLHSARLGAEYQGLRFARDQLQPYAGFSLLPTLALSPQSELEGDVSNGGLPMEAMLGMLYRPRFLREFWGMRSGTAGVGAHYIFGTVDHSRLNDLGLQAFFRVSL